MRRFLSLRLYYIAKMPLSDFNWPSGRGAWSSALRRSRGEELVVFQLDVRPLVVESIQSFGFALCSSVKICPDLGERLRAHGFAAENIKSVRLPHRFTYFAWL